MDNLFLTVLNMSFTAGCSVLVVLIVRQFLKKVPRIYSYALWAVVFFRLACPIHLESPWSLFPVNSRPISQDIMYEAFPQFQSGIPVIDRAVSSVLPAAEPMVSVNLLQIWIFLGEIIWLSGIGVILVSSGISALLLKIRLSDSKEAAPHLFISEKIRTPFVFGVFRPDIYLPAGIGEEEKHYILLHEQTHIRRHDPLIKLAAFLAVTVHWFNPLAWIAYNRMTLDMEMSCDEAVIRKMGNTIKKQYSTSLLALAAGERGIGKLPPAFGEGEVKSRIKNVLHYKKSSTRSSIIAASVVIAVTVGLIFSQPAYSEERVAWLEAAYRWRTPYAGNASAIGNITDTFYPMEDLRKTGIELNTSEEPYQVTIFYTSDMEAGAALRNYRDVLSRNGVLLFSLVENLDKIAVRINDATVAVYERSQAEELYGSLWEQTKSYGGFKTLYEKISQNPDSSVSPVS